MMHTVISSIWNTRYLQDPVRRLQANDGYKVTVFTMNAEEEADKIPRADDFVIAE
jgi:hypothetical protein